MFSPRSRSRSATASMCESTAIFSSNRLISQRAADRGFAGGLPIRFRVHGKGGTVMPVRPLFAQAYGYDRYFETHCPSPDQFRCEKSSEEGRARGQGADD